jgi:hypothetical protein
MENTVLGQPRMPVYNNGVPIAEGLTKREYFAAVALNGLCACNIRFREPKAVLAVQIADVLIAELNKQKK